MNSSTTVTTTVTTTPATKIDLTQPVGAIPVMPSLTGTYKDDDAYLKGLRAAVSAKGNRWMRSDECIGLATHCACCGKALKDALSVQLVIGPDCRRLHGDGQNVPSAPDWVAAKTIACNYGVDESAVADWSDPRAVCNLFLHIYALAAEANPWVPNAVDALGYRGLAKRMEARRDTFVKRAQKRADAEAKVAAERAAIAKRQARWTGASFTGAAPVAPAPVPQEVRVSTRTESWTYNGKTYSRDVLVVQSPKHEGFTNAIRNIPKRHWDSVGRVWTVPTDAKSALWAAIKANYAGLPLTAPDGTTSVIPAPAPSAN